MMEKDKKNRKVVITTLGFWEGRNGKIIDYGPLHYTHCTSNNIKQL